eukprot:6173618-Pleurochrysis_carterae.AAC.4
MGSLIVLNLRLITSRSLLWCDISAFETQLRVWRDVAFSRVHIYPPAGVANDAICLHMLPTSDGTVCISVERGKLVIGIRVQLFLSLRMNNGVYFLLD